jgi:hypothetical protein
MLHIRQAHPQNRVDFPVYLDRLLLLRSSLPKPRLAGPLVHKQKYDETNGSGYHQQGKDGDEYIRSHGTRLP